MNTKSRKTMMKCFSDDKVCEAMVDTNTVSIDLPALIVRVDDLNQLNKQGLTMR